MSDVVKEVEIQIIKHRHGKLLICSVNGDKETAFALGKAIGLFITDENTPKEIAEAYFDGVNNGIDEVVLSHIKKAE